MKTVIMDNGMMYRADEAARKDPRAVVVAEWMQGRGRILRGSDLPQPWVDDQWRPMLLTEHLWRLVCIKLQCRTRQPAGADPEAVGLWKKHNDCILDIIEWQKNEATDALHRAAPGASA